MEYIVSLNKVPNVKDNVIITLVGNESVVYPSYEDETDLPYVITLNEIGTFILKQIDGKNNIGNILDKIVSNYDVSINEAKGDLFNLIKDLIEEKIVIWKK